MPEKDAPYGLPGDYYRLVMKWFKQRTKGMDAFTSDDFREEQLDLQLYGDEANKIGGFFRWLKVNGYIEATGERRPTKFKQGHKRYITVWKWTTEVTKVLEEHDHNQGCNEGGQRPRCAG